MTTKLSALATNGSPTTSDFLVGVLAGLTGDNKVTIQSVLSLLVGGTSLSGQLQTQSNSGTAGGTMYYINLGGIKFLWGNTGSMSYSGTSAQFGITFPTGFFTTLQSWNLGQSGAGGTYGQKIEFATSYPTSSSALINITNSGTGSSQIYAGFFFVGS